MKEKFLHFVWNFQLFQSQNLKTVDDFEVQIINKGQWNSSDSGPDFFNSQIKIANTIWVGNIEIHVKSSDWDLHQHSQDHAYSNVILHVVFEHDKEIEFLQKRNIPTLELKNFIPKEILFNYKQLLEKEQKFIPCQESLGLVSKEKVNFWLERIFIQRLERKVAEIETEFLQNGKNWEQLLFKKLAYTFGLKINAEPFEYWVNSFDFKIIQKIQSRKEMVQALFLGQAGFLEINSENVYIKFLQKEFEFIKSKYNLQPLNSSIFKFFRLRPPNFPTVRLAQLASVYSQYPNLFMFLMGSKSAEKIYPVFSDLELNAFWRTHYTLDKESSRNSEKKITNELIERIIINVIIPIKFAYAKSLGKEINDELIDLLISLPAEKNTIIDEFSKMGFTARNAFESQAYLELKKHYCDVKNCLNCGIGLQILKNVR